MISICSSGSFSPLGLENNIVPDVQLSASSISSGSFYHFPAKDGRLYVSNAWCANGWGANEYLQIDLGKVVTITGLATQGCYGYNYWVKTYFVLYSNNEKEWSNVQTGLSSNVSDTSKLFNTASQMT